MRFFSSKLRAVAEALLTLAVLAVVTYDLVGRSEKASSTETVSVSFQAKAKEGASERLSSVPSTAFSKAVTSRFEALVDPTINSSSTFIICNTYVAPSNPWDIGSVSRQALIFLGNAQCPSDPTVLNPGNTTYGAVHIFPFSWLSLQNVQNPPITGASGPLTMDAGSQLEAVIPAYFVANPYSVFYQNLLISSGPCPSFSGVTFTITGCPVDTTLTSVGTYNCYLSSASTPSSCTLSLTIGGALSAQAPVYLAITMGKDCSSFTQTTFKIFIQGATGVPALAILITYWQCASVVSYMTVLGGTPGQAMAALNAIYTSALSGPLRTLLSVISVAIVTSSSPANPYNYTTTTVAYPYSYPYVLPYLVPYSESNPGLLALLTLLIIPVMLGLGLLCWCACRVRTCPPCPCPCPAPCPAPCEMQPLCMPCDPCMGGTMMGAPMGGSPMLPPTGYPTF